MLKTDCVQAISLALVKDGTSSVSIDVGALTGDRPSGITITPIDLRANTGALDIFAAEMLQSALLHNLKDIPSDRPLSKPDFDRIESAVTDFYNTVKSTSIFPGKATKFDQERDAVIARLQQLVEEERSGGSTKA